MAGQFNASTPVLHTAATNARTVNEELQSLLARMLADLEPLSAAANWQGDAQASFQRVKVQWADAARKINQGLLGIGEQLDASARQYAADDAASRQGFTGLTR